MTQMTDLFNRTFDEEMARTEQQAAYPPAGLEAGFVSVQAAPEVQPVEEVYHGFEVQDIGAADWAVRKIARYRELRKQVDDYVAAVKKSMDDYKKAMDDRYDSHINFLTEKLRPFAEQQIAGTKMKSFQLPSGRLQFRTGYSFDKDEAKLLAYVKIECPDYVKVTEEVKWGDFKKQLKWTPDGQAVTPDGEVLDFVSRKEEKTFKVE